MNQQCILSVILLIITTTTTNVVLSLECASYLSSSTTSKHNIPSEYINDNYCDCPFTGEDEPNTSACSGSIGWSSGMHEEEDEDSRNFFQCPGQPNLVLPSSKVNDNICDCCNGGDEAAGVCADVCGKVLAEERRAKRELKESFDAGYNNNMQMKKEYKEFLESTTIDIQNLQHRLNDLDWEVTQLARVFKEDITQWRMGRRGILEELVISDSFSWILALTPSEARTLILGLCQVSGEWWYTYPKVAEVENESHACIPLHLAAFELGYMFDTNLNPVEFTSWKAAEEDRPHAVKALPELLLELELGYTGTSDKQAVTRDVPDTTTSEQKEDDEDDKDDMEDEHFYGSDDDLNDGYEMDDDITHNHEQQQNDQPNEEEVLAQSSSTDTEQDQPSLVLPRLDFEIEAKQILQMVQAIFDTPDDDNDVDTEDEISHIDGGNNNEEEEQMHEVDEESMPPPEQHTKKPTQPKLNINIPPNLDTIQLQQVQKNIQTYLKHINIGKSYLKSADTLIDSLMENNSHIQQDDYLFPLVLLSLIYHSRVTSIDLYSILFYSLPEIKQGDDESFCNSSALPSIERTLKFGNGDIVVVTIPSRPILDGVKNHCQQRVLDNAACADQSIEVDSVIIPYHVENGCISNYFPTTYYDQNNPNIISKNILPSFQMINAQVSISKQNDINNIRKQMETIQKEIKEKEESTSSDKLGLSGELFAFRDNDCFEKKANQYTYEVCMLGTSYQKEGTSKTSLGSFQSFTIEEEGESKTPSMFVSFQDGQRCWQGVNRKSKVLITCGSSLGELLSADEPEVCSYEFMFKSFIGCNEAFGREHGLLDESRENGECTDGECSSN